MTITERAPLQGPPSGTLVAAPIAKVGVNSLNRVTKAIEVSGQTYLDPLDEPSRAAAVALWWMILEFRRGSIRVRTDASHQEG